LINQEDQRFSVREQAKLLTLNRSSFYYKSNKNDKGDLKIKEMIDKIFTEYPYYGTRRIVAILKRKKVNINRKRCQRLMQEMGIYAIQPTKNLSKSEKAAKKYPYLLRGKTIIKANEVWCSDITYIPMGNGFCYLTVVMDWGSRKILSYRISDSLESDFCIEALKEAFKKGNRPQIFNTDQGVQYTSERYTEILKEKGIKISMDGRGRALDNIMVERFWRSLKYEDIYIKDYCSVEELTKGLKKYIYEYNNKRPHSTFEYHTPQEVYSGKYKIKRAHNNKKRSKKRVA
jgi:putative transposase